MSLLFRIKTFFLTVGLFFSFLFSGGLANLTENYVYYNYQYGTHERQCLDLVIPKDLAGDAGLVLFIHGGGYTAGSKDEYRGLIFEGAAKHKVAYAAINYRYASEEVGFDEIIEDITAAVTAIKSLAAERGVNLNKMILNGTSAGGHLSLLYAYEFRETAPITPVGVVSFCGVSDYSDPAFFDKDMMWYSAFGNWDYINELFSYFFKTEVTNENRESLTETFLKYSPITYVDENTVPTALFHGNKDNIVPYSNAVALDAKLEQVGVTHKLVTGEGLAHNILSDAAYCAVALAELDAFTELYLLNR